MFESSVGPSRDPGQAVAVLLVRQYICTWLFADSCLLLRPSLLRRTIAQASFVLTGTVQTLARLAPVAVSAFHSSVVKVLD